MVKADINEITQITKSPVVSVIVTAYNTEKYIVDCLDSLIAQTLKDFEAICIDDGSTDKSLSIFNEYAALDPRIKVLSQKNQGVVAARNNAIAIAQGEYIFSLDSDDKISSNCLEIIYKFIVKHNYALVCPGWTVFGTLKTGKIYWDCPKPTKYNMYAKAAGLINSSMYPKKFWEKYGGYDRLFDDGMEDYDFLLNFIDDGQKITRLPDRLFYYRYKSSEESRNWRACNREVRDQLYANLCHKHPKMVKYRLLYKIINPLHKLFRFLLRWGMTYDQGFIVRVCKITVYRRSAADEKTSS